MAVYYGIYDVTIDDKHEVPILIVEVEDSIGDEISVREQSIRIFTIFIEMDRYIDKETINGPEEHIVSTYDVQKIADSSSRAENVIKTVGVYPNANLTVSLP